jgi:hypothetical protein
MIDTVGSVTDKSAICYDGRGVVSMNKSIDIAALDYRRVLNLLEIPLFIQHESNAHPHLCLSLELCGICRTSIHVCWHVRFGAWIESRPGQTRVNHLCLLAKPVRTTPALLSIKQAEHMANSKSKIW